MVMPVNEFDNSQSTTAQSFQLTPFPDGAIVPAMQITGTVAREGNYLTITYHVEGDVNAIAWPELVATPQRVQGLWEQTCLECFIGVPGQSHYWEVNLAPNHNWNLFALSDYRSGLRESPMFEKLPFDCYSAFDQVTLVLRLDLAKLIAISEPIEVSITAVIQTLADQQCSYWAIAHTSKEADFHRRDSFVLRLPSTATA
jgi:hypothetical protein